MDLSAPDSTEELDNRSMALPRRQTTAGDIGPTVRGFSPNPDTRSSDYHAQTTQVRLTPAAPGSPTSARMSPRGNLMPPSSGSETWPSLHMRPAVPAAASFWPEQGLLDHGLGPEVDTCLGERDRLAPTRSVQDLVSTVPRLNERRVSPTQDRPGSSSRASFPTALPPGQTLQRPYLPHGPSHAGRVSPVESRVPSGGAGAAAGPAHSKNSGHGAQGGHGASVSQRKTELYKTELCRKWSERGSCRYGSKCQFAHGAAELRPVERHHLYKTQVCRTFASTGGHCPYGLRCTFLHPDMDKVGEQNAVTSSSRPAAMPSQGASAAPASQTSAAPAPEPPGASGGQDAAPPSSPTNVKPISARGAATTSDHNLATTAAYSTPTHKRGGSKARPAHLRKSSARAGSGSGNGSNGSSAAASATVAVSRLHEALTHARAQPGSADVPTAASLGKADSVPSTPVAEDPSSRRRNCSESHARFTLSHARTGQRSPRARQARAGNFSASTERGTDARPRLGQARSSQTLSSTSTIPSLDSLVDSPPPGPGRDK